MTDAPERAATALHALVADARYKNSGDVLWVEARAAAFALAAAQPAEPTPDERAAAADYMAREGAPISPERLSRLMGVRPTEPTPECPACGRTHFPADSHRRPQAPDSSDVQLIVSPAWMSALLREQGILTESPGIRSQIAGRMAERVAAALRGEERQTRTVSGTGLARAAARAVVAAHDEAGLPVNQATRDLAEGDANV